MSQPRLNAPDNYAIAGNERDWHRRLQKFRLPPSSALRCFDTHFRPVPSNLHFFVAAIGRYPTSFPINLQLRELGSYSAFSHIQSRKIR